MTGTANTANTVNVGTELDEGQSLKFNPETGMFEGGSLDGGGEPDFDDGVDFDSQPDFDGPSSIDVQEASGLADKMEPEGEESSNSLDDEEEFDPIEDLLADDELLRRLAFTEASKRASSPQYMSALNEEARHYIQGRPNQQMSLLSAYLSSRANKVAEKRELRCQKKFDAALDNFRETLAAATPWNFNPNDPESVDTVKKYFAEKGAHHIPKLQAAFEDVRGSAKMFLDNQRSSCAKSSCSKFQNEVAGPVAEELKKHEKLLKCIKSDADPNKTLFDDMKSGLGGMLDLAKMAFAKVAGLLGILKGEQPMQQQQQQQQQVSSHSSAPRM